MHKNANMYRPILYRYLQFLLPHTVNGTAPEMEYWSGSNVYLEYRVFGNHFHFPVTL